jgi:hypothetical protein
MVSKNIAQVKTAVKIRKALPAVKATIPLNALLSVQKRLKRLLHLVLAVEAAGLPKHLAFLENHQCGHAPDAVCFGKGLVAVEVNFQHFGRVSHARREFFQLWAHGLARPAPICIYVYQYRRDAVYEFLE